MRGSTLLVPVLVATVAGGGCSRKFFREYTDKDVAGVITQKNIFPDWRVKNWFVYPDPRARFADPYNPDRPPYPPDDFASRALSPNPQKPTKKSGVGRVDGDGYLHVLQRWDAENRAVAAAEPLPPPKPGGDAPKPPDPKPSGAADLWVPARPRAEVTPAGGTKGGGGKVVPAGGVPAGQPPATLPDVGPPQDAQDKGVLPVPPPVLQPDPKAADPKKVPGGVPDITAAVAAGDSDPDYLRALASNQQGFRIRVDQAVELGLINSREFQDRREDLYLAALPVTLERYNFAAQAFFTEQVARTSLGQDLGGAGQFWNVDTTTGFSKLFPTGARLLVQFANQVVINLGRGDPTVAVSDFTLTLAQPFLRGGGFAVTLENLTQTERNMVYAMRSYARFRKLFYTATLAGGATSGGLTNNPYGLQGLSVNLGRGIGGNLTSPVVGYLPILQQVASIRNQQTNVSALEGLLRQYEAYREAGQIAPLQVGQVEVNLLQSRGQLLGTAGGGGAGQGGSGIRGYLDSIDSYKLQLGLPLTVGLDLDDTPLRPIRQQLARFEDIYADLRQLEANARRFDPTAPAEQYRAQWRRLLTESDLVKGTTFAKGIAARWDAWARLTPDEISTREAGILKQRSVLLDNRVDRRVKNLPEPPEEVDRLAGLEADLELAGFERAVRGYEAKPWEKVKGPEAAGIQGSAFQRMFTAFFQVVLGASNERLAGTRKQWPKLPGLPVNGTDLLTTELDEAYTAGLQTALSLRLDLMNARGQVVDAYRQVAVQANSLQGVLNVQYDLNSSTPPDVARPFSFSGDRTRSTLTFRGELPLVRRAERNNYRASLVGYQRQRRTLMAFEDNIANDVRGDIRQLRTIAELYKIQQRVVELGYSQYDSARETQFQPLAAGQVQDPGSSAALTQQLLQNQQNLLNAQNTLYGLWVSYLSARMNLYLDLELMQIDERGVWNDEQAAGLDDVPRDVPAGRPDRERLPPPRPAGPADDRK